MQILNITETERKIILSQKGPKIDLWDGAEEKYKPMMIADGKITKLTKYGAFVELEKGISGLIHKTKPYLAFHRF